jgi:hypothetical protein
MPTRNPRYTPPSIAQLPPHSFGTNRGRILKTFLPISQHRIVNKSRESAKIILSALKIEMRRPHVAASALAAMYPDGQSSVKPMRGPIKSARAIRRPDSRLQR